MSALEFVCPWCGADLLDEFMSRVPTTYDAVLEDHVQDCEPWLIENEPDKRNHYMSPLCDEEE